MRLLITLILAMTLSNTIGQTVYDKAVSAQFINLYKKLPPSFRIEFDQKNKDSSSEDGLAIFTEFECDTLNKTEQKKSNLPEIELIDVKTAGLLKMDNRYEKKFFFFIITFCEHVYLMTRKLYLCYYDKKQALSRSAASLRKEPLFHSTSKHPL